MEIISGILFLIGAYFIFAGAGFDTPVGIGILGLSFLFSGSFGTGLICILIAFVWGAIFLENEKNGTHAKKRQQEQEQITNEYYNAVASQKDRTPWSTVYATEPCPHCGHYKVRNAKWEDKRLSISFWGVASNAIGKSFKCEHCGSMW